MLAQLKDIRERLQDAVDSEDWWVVKAQMNKIDSILYHELQKDRPQPVIEEDGKKVCNCIEPEQSFFPDGRYYCMKCWGEWYH